MAVKHVFKPVRPLFSLGANVNIRSDEQIRLEQLRNEQSQLSIDSLKETMRRNKAIEEDRDAADQRLRDAYIKEQEYNKSVERTWENQGLTFGEKTRKLSDIEIKYHPERGIPALRSNIKEINAAMRDVKGDVDDEALKVFQMDGADARAGNVDSINSVLTQVSRLQVKRKLGIGRGTTPTEFRIDNARKGAALISGLESFIKKNPNYFTKEEIMLVDAGQVDDRVIGMAKKINLPNADYLSLALPGTADVISMAGDRSLIDRRIGLTELSYQQQVINDINKGYRSEKSQDLWLSRIIDPDQNEILKEDLQSRISYSVIEENLPKSLTSWFTGKQSDLETILDPRNKKVLSSIKEKAPDTYDLIIAYKGLLGKDFGGTPDLYFKHYLDKVMFSEKRRLLNQRRQPKVNDIDPFKEYGGSRTE